MRSGALPGADARGVRAQKLGRRRNQAFAMWLARFIRTNAREPSVAERVAARLEIRETYR